MPLLRALSCVAVVCVLLGPRNFSLGASEPATLELDDEAAVVRAVIDWILIPANNANAPSGTAGPVFVKRSAAVCDFGPATDRDCLPEKLVAGLRASGSSVSTYAFVPEPLRKAFLERNRESRDLVDPGRPGLMFTSREELRALAPNITTWWEKFRARFPGAAGCLLLSAPSVDTERRQALVYVDHTYGLVGGVGKLLLLTRNDAGWQITQSASISIS